MKKKFKLGKLLVVIFLTILIWVWADRAKTEALPITTGLIKINESADPKLWITFYNKKFVNIDKIVLEGPASKIDDFQRKLREKKLAFEFFLGTEQQPALAEPGDHSINVADVLRKSQEIRQSGLIVKSCIPENVKVQVHKLVEKELYIECFDEQSSLPLRTESINPEKVTINVPEDWTRPAQLKLSASEITQAMSQPITAKLPFIELEDGQRRYSSTTVSIKLPQEPENLQPQSIPMANLGIVSSPNLFGKYQIKLKNEPDLVTVSFRATNAAYQLYKEQTYHMFLYIVEEDAKEVGEQSKPVVYNFPYESFRNNEIELIPTPAVAKFELIPIPQNE